MRYVKVNNHKSDCQTCLWWEKNDWVDQKLKAYVPTSGNRPNPQPDVQLSVGLTVGCFAAMNSTCQGTERIALLSSQSQPSSPFILLFWESLWRGHQTTLLWAEEHSEKNPTSCSPCVPKGGGVSERVEVGSPDWKVLILWPEKWSSLVSVQQIWSSRQQPVNVT